MCCCGGGVSSLGWFLEVCEWMMYLVGISNDHRSLSVVFKLMDVCLWNGVVEGSRLWFILCGVGIQNGLWCGVLLAAG